MLEILINQRINQPALSGLSFGHNEEDCYALSLYTECR